MKSILVPEYGLIAEAMRYPGDFSWVEFRLNPNATWQDGKTITVEDVIWSFNTAIELSPSQKFYYANVEKGEKTGEHTVKLHSILQIIGNCRILWDNS